MDRLTSVLNEGCDGRQAAEGNGREPVCPDVLLSLYSACLVPSKERENFLEFYGVFCGRSIPASLACLWDWEHWSGGFMREGAGKDRGKSEKHWFRVSPTFSSK